MSYYILAHAFCIVHALNNNGEQFLLLSQYGMFQQASAFNQDISNWDLSSGYNFVSGLGLLWETCSSSYCFLYYSSSSSEWTKQTKALHTSSFFNNLTTPIIVNNNGAPLLLLSQLNMFREADAFNQPSIYCKYQSNQNFLDGEQDICLGSTISCGWGQTDCPTTAPPTPFPWK